MAQELVSPAWIQRHAPHFANQADMRALCRRGHYPDDLAHINPNILILLECLRVQSGVPFLLLCGYEERPGAHGKGEGVDFCVLTKADTIQQRLQRMCAESLRVWMVARSLCLTTSGPTGLGFYPQGRVHPMPYFHLDTMGRPNARRGEWLGWPDMDPDFVRSGRIVYAGVDLVDLLRSMATAIETGNHVNRIRRGVVR